MKKKVALVYGTRPELIKLAPVVFALKNSKQLAPVLINTGQHAEMVVDLEKIFGITPDYALGVMRKAQSINQLIANIIQGIEPVLKEINPEVVIIQGDTTTVFTTGMVCFNLGIKVAHVEAGLRSNDLFQPFPEEFNRKVVSIFSEFSFAPTRLAQENLVKEGVAGERIYLTGNTVVDAVNWMIQNAKFSSQTTLLNKKLSNKKTILVTAHRRENHGNGIYNICTAIKNIIDEKNNEFHFIWPVHPNPNVKEVVKQELHACNNVTLTEPLPYFDLLAIIKESYMVWTDSGGIQEEVASLRKPVLILRNVTERPEIVKSGFGVLCGTKPSTIINKTLILLNKEEYNKAINGTNPFGDGTAAKKIAAILENKL